jgi:cytochrome c
MACSSCHVNQYTLMEASFAKPYPHRVKMPEERAGVSEVNAAEMVNFCMLVPMQSEPLAWGSEELSALAAYVEAIRPGYRPVASTLANPCNPCGMKRNPCAPRGR